jgi:hypothetical protein
MVRLDLADHLNKGAQRQDLFWCIRSYMYSLVEIHAEHLFIPADSRTRGIAAFRTIYTRADVPVYRFSFFPHTIITWNSIPPDVRQASTIGQFQAERGSITLPVQSQVEKRYASASVYIVLKAAIPLVLLSAGMSRCSAWISTKLCTILYIRTDLAFARICSRHVRQASTIGQFQAGLGSSTLPVQS